mmetsp:Transcript_30425/g.76172  ORF Transcript_30425/g.76172 Transcript_30425/m.76172 type:complete len:254 (+) Transcript_30425:943-1704(+)
MIFKNVVSMRSKRFASSGSWCRMSSEPMKMLSRYIHLRCTNIHTSITSPMRLNFASHARTSSRNGFTNRLAIIDCSVKPMSSSSTVTSSVLRRMYPRSSVPLLYLASSKRCSFQVAARLATSPSILSSFSALTHISSMSSAYLCSSIENSAPRVKTLGSVSKVVPVISMSCCQWRGRRASDFRLSMRGRELLKAVIFSSTSPNTAEDSSPVPVMPLRRCLKSSVKSNSFFKSSSDHSVVLSNRMVSTWALYNP